MPLFDETLVHQKYLKSYYTNNTTSNNISLDVNNFDAVNLDYVGMSVINTNTTIYTQQQKFKEMQYIFCRLATVISEQGTNQYHKTRDQIKLLVELINNHKEFLIVENIRQNVDESIIREQNFSTEKCANHEGEEKNENIEANSNNTEKLNETKGNNISDATETECVTDECGTTLIESHKETIESMYIEGGNGDSQNNKDESGEINSNSISNHTCLTVVREFHKEYYHEGDSKIKNKRQIDKQKDTGMTLGNIKLPLMKKARGRPKNIDVTAIGIKRIQKLKRHQLFVNKRLFQRQQLMLECFLQKDKIKQIMYNNELITETYISDLLPDKINCMLFEDRVQINEIQQFSTAKAFKQFQELLKIRKTIKNYF
ncbi:unnamed protein product [Psylliodes chrysocephalus]|uniref:Uncharacterized protein n=1 Tax=Psylliodes chrysocephalus TaxID=3402493 RepID=A0A9P0G8I3_9CUCU|nr:unnamed protein product [Psylliodes chrysocephala]